MYLSLNWVKNWIKLPDLSKEEIGQDLTMKTVEVESVIDQRADFENIVVGRVKAIARHPQADRLQVVEVDIGDGIQKVVCGGTNLRVGMLVAFAKIGARVKWHGQGEHVTLAKAKIRGVESSGMIASASEIGLSNLFPQASEYEILDLSDFKKIKPGQNLATALGLDDVVIDIENKSINHRPDLWGQYGLARELAAIYKTKIRDYKITNLTYKNNLKIKVTVEDQDNCYRYMALALSNVKVQESPWWLKVRLYSAGLRPINNIVDVTNYVMYELGQPLHAFDAARVTDHHIFVKKSSAKEKFVTLDGQTRKLPIGALMIADSAKNLAIAGIMGGQNSEISAETTDIILESASFKASNIRRSSQLLGLRSESSARFEKSLDPLFCESALAKAAQMILALCPESFVSSHLVDINHNPFKKISLEVPENLINQRFGSVIPTSEIKDILKRLQFEVRHKSKIFYITVPTWRSTKDISIPEDIVEEVARIYGYDNLQTSLPNISLQNPVFDIATQAGQNIKNWLALAQGYTEIYTYPFASTLWSQKLGFDLSKQIKVKNALNPETNYLNISLLPNIFKAAEDNSRFYSDFKIFELQRVFDKSAKGFYHLDQTKKKFLPKQDYYLCGVEASKNDTGNLFLSIKGLMQSLVDYANIKWNAERTSLPYARLAFCLKHQDIVWGHFGVITHDKINIGFWEINFSLLIKYISNKSDYKKLARFPGIRRDMAIVVDKNILWQDLQDAISKVSPLIRSIVPFDVFEGRHIEAGKKSVAFHLEFRSDDKTLESEDIDEIMKNLAEVLEKKFEAKLR